MQRSGSGRSPELAALTTTYEPLAAGLRHIDDALQALGELALQLSALEGRQASAALEARRQATLSAAAKLEDDLGKVLFKRFERQRCNEL